MVEARTGSPREVAESMLLRSGYLAMLEADDSVEAETRKQNLREVIGSIVEYEAEPRATAKTRDRRSPATSSA